MKIERDLFDMLILRQAAGFEDHAGPSEFVKTPLITNHSSNHEEADSTFAQLSIYRCLRGKAVEEICNFSFIGFMKTKHTGNQDLC